jgi:hypothetical protein
MTDRPEYIQLEPNDDIVHLRDRLSFIRGRRVLIIWPEHGTALTRRLDIVLVQREAKRRSLQIAFVTHDKNVINHARDLGISTFETIGAAEGARWKRIRPKIFTRRHHRPETEPTPDELISAASRVRRAERRVHPVLNVAFRLMIVLGLGAVIGGTVYAVVPSAKVTITLRSDQIQITETITAAPDQNDVDVEAARIPATRLRVEVQTVGTVPTTGASTLDSTPAIGVVTFTNQTLSPITIKPGTQVATTGFDPVYFRTIGEVTLRGGVGQRQEVAIEALPESAGERSNVPPGAITVVQGELATAVTVNNTAATTGGEDRQFTTVTAADQERLLRLVRAQLQSSAFEEIRQSLTDSQVIVIETIRIAEERSDWTRFSHALGDITPNLSLDMRAVVEAVVIDDRFARQVMFARLSSHKPTGKVLLPDTFTYERGAVVSVTEDEIRFEATASMVANTAVDATQLAERLAGKTLSEAQALIAASINSDMPLELTFSLHPDSLPHLPLLPVRIVVETVYQ